MKQNDTLFDVLKCVIDRNRDEYTEELHWEEWGDGTRTLEFDPCGGMPIDDAQWMLRGATDEEAKIILRVPCARQTIVGSGACRNLAGRMSRRLYAPPPVRTGSMLSWIVPLNPHGE